MVLQLGLHQWCIDVLSVLALSSRFDGLVTTIAL